jgi:cytochrome b pre-mRNA-processing protein 3
VFDAMFNDMDVNLRELGVGDMTVGKKVRAMWEAFHGRAAAYQAPLEAGDSAGLAEALARNVWRGVSAGDPAKLARISLAQTAYLDGQTLDDLQAGRVRFLAAAEAVA